jgi:hypothetical protein
MLYGEAKYHTNRQKYKTHPKNDSVPFFYMDGSELPSVFRLPTGGFYAAIFS